MSIKKAALAFALAAALLSGCGGPEDPPSESASKFDAPEQTQALGQEQLEAMYGAYETALNIFCHEKILPDGTYIDSVDYGMDGNSFAVFDIDGDGADELMIVYSSTGKADMSEMIYGYNAQAGELYEQFMRFPNLEYYDNGVIIAYFSQNKGLAGRFWPYYVYKYDPAGDVYDCVAMADAWDGSVFGSDNNGRPFPEEIDTSGERMVYYLVGADEPTAGEPVDKSEYERWLRGYIGGAEQMTVPWLPLTPENIAAGARGTGAVRFKLDGGGERNFYSSVTGLSKAEVESFALKVRRSILSHDWQTLARYVNFPVTVNGVECADIGALLSAAPELLADEDLVAALVSETCEELPCGGSDITMAGGRVRIVDTDGRLCVRAIGTPA